MNGIFTHLAAGAGGFFLGFIARPYADKAKDKYVANRLLRRDIERKLEDEFGKGNVTRAMVNKRVRLDNLTTQMLDTKEELEKALQKVESGAEETKGTGIMDRLTSAKDALMGKSEAPQVDGGFTPLEELTPNTKDPKEALLEISDRMAELRSQMIDLEEAAMHIEHGLES